MDQSVEQWRPVVGYEGRYEVSDHGRVRSLDRVVPDSRLGQRRMKGRITKPWPRGTGGTSYWAVWLSRDGRREARQVHHLVLEAFVGPRPEGMIGRHGTGGAHDSRLCNLRWGTQSDNSGIDKWEQGTMVYGEKHPRAKLTEGDVLTIRAARGSQREIARRFGIAQSTVGRIRLRKVWAWLKEPVVAGKD